jgi:hypothetical protein
MGYIEEYEDSSGKVKKLKTKKKTYKMGFSIVDKLSISQTKKLEAAIYYREHHINSRNRFFLGLNKTMVDKSGIETNFPEIGRECDVESCSCWAIGTPKFIEISEGKGYLHLDCDCGRKIWITPFKEITTEPKPLTELEKEIKEGEEN